MNPDNSEKAINLSRRARTQGKHAVKNMGKAAQVAAEPVLEEAQEFGGEVLSATKRLSLSNNTTQAILGMSVAIGAAVFATSKFKGVYAGRQWAKEVLTKEGHHLIPSEPVA